MAKKIDPELLEDLKESLIYYSDRILYLARKGSSILDIYNYFEENPPEDKMNEIQNRLNKEDLTETEKNERKEALEIIKKQSETLERLENIKENIEAKLDTALLRLRNVQLNFIRLDYITQEQASSAVETLNTTSEQIDDYIESMNEILNDLENI